MGALKLYHRGLQLDQNQPEAWISIGNIHYYNKDNSQALRAYEKAKDLRPDHARTYNNIGTIHKENGNYPDALSNY